MNVKHMLLCATALGAFTALTACARAPEMSGTNAAVTAPPVTRATTADALTATPPPTVSPVVLRGDAIAPSMVVHKSASCGCCGLWVDHMRAAGFAVDVRNSDDLNPLKERAGVPYGKGSCHTAEVGGYFIEGHVPAEDIKRLLAEKPDAKGLVLPGMPMGSPGMESPDGTVQPYTVELVGRDGATTAFAEHVGTQ